jgi:hypothetical protein
MRYRCKHVNYVESTHCRGEREYLFSPYSVFEVEAVHWSPGSNYLRPHEITLRHLAIYIYIPAIYMIYIYSLTPAPL